MIIQILENIIFYHIFKIGFMKTLNLLVINLINYREIISWSKTLSLKIVSKKDLYNTFKWQCKYYFSFYL